MSQTQRRWRLILGRYSEKGLSGLAATDERIDKALDFLYDREYQNRGLARDRSGGSLDPTQIKALTWLGEARKLFPKSVFETLQEHALAKYEINELLADPELLDNLEANQDLLKTLLSFEGRANPAVKDKLRQVANKVVQEIILRLRSDVQRAFSGRKNPFRRSHIPSVANFDWRNTLRRNVKNYDPNTQKIIAEDLRFISRQRRRLPWSVILCVDQSGSMTDSLIHSAVMATILSSLPGVNVSMVLFDTSIIDVSDKLSDPLETLLSVQLGGGTYIGQAVEYCETLVQTPDRTVFVLITDFAEGASPQRFYRALARMNEARVRLLGLTALDDVGSAYFDARIAGKVKDLGMHIGAMTPNNLAQWLAERMS